jgi:hypothetical protein
MSETSYPWLGSGKDAASVILSIFEGIIMPPVSYLLFIRVILIVSHRFISSL